MKNLKKHLIKIIPAVIFFSILGCERDLSDEVREATFPKNGDVFIDGFSSGLEYYPFAGSKFTAFSVEEDQVYRGSTAMRFDVPNVGDPEGAYAGAIFRDDNGGRDLTEFDALTFWAKATTAATLNEVGFGQDFGDNKYLVTLPNLALTTNWVQYTIPLPDPSVLTQETGLFWYAEGPENGAGYSIFVDEVQFEKLGNIAQPRPMIFEGNDVSQQTFAGTSISMSGLLQTMNLGNGQDVTVAVAPAYFEFTSSDTSVATVSEDGSIQVNGSGTTTITATLNGVQAPGSLTLESLGNFTAAPVPTRDASNVISIFSDAYTNVPVIHYNGYFAPFQTTLGQDDININGDNIIKYTDLNFVATEFYSPTVNATGMSYFHVDIQVEDSSVDPGDFIRIELVDFGSDASFGGGNDTSGTYTINSSVLTAGSWISLDIPLTSFPGLINRDNLAQILFVSDATISTILVDNMYFYTEPTSPTVAAPAPTEPAANVISLFSDSYTNVTVDTFRTSWSSGPTVLTDEVVAGNNIKKYENLGFAGIETTSSTIDASAMTHFHIDTWSADYTSFAIKLVDFGSDNAFGGGDDTEHEITFTNPGTGQWQSFDIPLTDFINLTNTSNIAQYVIVAQPFENADVFIDNMYFYN